MIYILFSERKLFRKDRPFGFSAKPVQKADGSTDMLTWECIVPGWCVQRSLTSGDIVGAVHAAHIANDRLLLPGCVLYLVFVRRKRRHLYGGW